MSKDQMLSLLLAAVGLFTIVCATMNFDFFMNHDKAKPFVKLLGRNGARVFYILAGFAFFLFVILRERGR